MPDIHGNYSLKETARKLDATSAFINRIQRETGIGGKPGTKGSLVSFSEQDIETFGKIKTLRLLDFSFKEIKDFWNIECKLIDICPKIRKTHHAYIKEKVVGFLPLIIHTETLNIPHPVGVVMDRGHKELKEYGELQEKFSKIAHRIKARVAGFEEISKVVNEIFDRLF